MGLLFLISKRTYDAEVVLALLVCNLLEACNHASYPVGFISCLVQLSRVGMQSMMACRQMSLEQLAQLAMSSLPKDMDALVSQALAAFQLHQSMQSCGVPSSSFISLIATLGFAGLWETAFSVYKIVPVGVRAYCLVVCPAQSPLN